MSNNRVTQEEIDALLDASETQEHIFWEQEAPPKDEASVTLLTLGK